MGRAVLRDSAKAVITRFERGDVSFAAVVSHLSGIPEGCGRLHHASQFYLGSKVKPTAQGKSAVHCDAMPCGVPPARRAERNSDAMACLSSYRDSDSGSKG